MKAPPLSPPLSLGGKIAVDVTREGGEKGADSCDERLPRVHTFLATP